MHHRVLPALRASALVATGLIVAGCASPEQRAAAAAELAAQREAQATMRKVKDNPNADALAMDSASVQRRRERIAAVLEKNAGYGGGRAPPKLVNAKFAGPARYEGILWVKGEVVYCASAQVLWPLSLGIPHVRGAVLRIKKTENGEVMESRVYDEMSPPHECRKAEYSPFPELELARTKRRQGLGIAD